MDPWLGDWILSFLDFTKRAFASFMEGFSAIQDLIVVKLQGGYCS